MKFSIIFLVFLLVFTISRSQLKENNECSQDARRKFVPAFFNFCIKMFITAQKFDKNNFLISQYTAYLELAAIAEGATGELRSELFEVLQLPEDPCIRHKFYEILSSSDDGGITPEFNISVSRIFAVDENIKLNETWAEEVTNAGLLKPLILPLKSNPSKALTMLPNNFLKTDDVQTMGDSIIMGSLYFRNLWNTAFSDGKIIKNVPFYGESVNMFHVIKRVQMAYIPSFKMKMLKLPVGEGERYNFIFAMNDGLDKSFDVYSAFTVETVVEAFALVAKSVELVNIVIPSIKIVNPNYDLKSILEEMGVKRLWSDGESLRKISEPGANPSKYIQNIVIDVDADGPEEEYSLPTKVEEPFAEDLTFIANRPFLYCLVDSNRKVILFGGAYTG